MSPCTDSDSGAWRPEAPLIVALLALFLAGGACSWTQRPSAKAAVARPMDVGGGASTEARLFPVSDGRWALLEPQNSSDSSQSRGLYRLSFATDGGETASHFFGEISRHGWGAYLQRLDGGAVDAPAGNASLSRLDPGRHVESHGPPVCYGDAVPPSESACLAEAASGTRWFLYGADDGRLLSSEAEKYAFPLGPRLLVERPSRDGGVRIRGDSDALPESWWAIPAGTEGARALDTRVVVGVDEACPPGASGIDELEMATRIRAKIGPIDHPLRVSDQAYGVGADALLTCDGDRVRAAVPALFRPILETGTGTHVGPTTLARRPLSVAELEPDNRALLLRALGRTAVGRPRLALADLRELFAETPADDLGAIPLRSMSVAAAGGTPEAALRWGYRSTDADWNRTTNPDYLLGRAAALSALGRRESSVVDLQAARRAAGRETETRNWLEWAALVSNAAPGGPPLGETRERARDHRDENRMLWARMLEWSAARARPGYRPDSAPDSADTSHLAKALARRGVATDCNASLCPLDVYGRRLADLVTRSDDDSALERAVAGLRHLGSAAFRPGFDTLPGWSSLPDGARRLELAFALVPHYRHWPSAAGRKFVESAVASSVGLPKYCGKLDDDSPTLERLERAARTGRVELRLMHWLADHLRSDACGKPVGVASSLAEWSNGVDGGGIVAAAVFNVLFERAESAGARTKVARFAARTLRDGGPADSCRRWHLAYTVAAVRAERFDLAEETLEEAVNCPGSATDSIARTSGLLHAYVAFQNSGQLPRHLQPELATAARRLARRTSRDGQCAGLESFDYDVEPEIDDSVGRIADKLAVPPADSSGQTLQRASQTDQLDFARQQLEKTRNALTAGRLADGVDPLKEARAAFGRIGHLPGETVTGFLAAALFDGEPGEYDDDSELECDSRDLGGELDGETVRNALSSQRGRRCLLVEHGADDTVSAIEGPEDDWTPASLRGWVAFRLLVGPLPDAQRAAAPFVDDVDDADGTFHDLCGAGPEWQEQF